MFEPASVNFPDSLYAAAVLATAAAVVERRRRGRPRRGGLRRPGLRAGVRESAGARERSALFPLFRF